MSAPPLQFLKLGGSLITDKNRLRTPRREVIRRLAEELAEARRRGAGPVLVGHGSGSYGHPEAAEANLPAGVRGSESLAGTSRTQAAARELHALVVGELLAAGVLPFSLAPSAFLVAGSPGPEVLTLEPLRRALALGLTPVVFGDVVFDRGQGISICSTEEVLLALARALPEAERPGRAIWLGDTPGVLAEDGEVISNLTHSRWHALPVGPGTTTDVTGGIRLRVETAFALAEIGIPSLIAGGLTPGLLADALAGTTDSGTVVIA